MYFITALNVFGNSQKSKLKNGILDGEKEHGKSKGMADEAGGGRGGDDA